MVGQLAGVCVCNVHGTFTVTTISILHLHYYYYILQITRKIFVAE